MHGYVKDEDKDLALLQMRLIYAAEKQASMRQAWVDVIYLNVIMALKLLLEVIESIEISEAEQSESILQQSTSKLNRMTSLSCFSTLSASTTTSTVVPAVVREPSKALLARLRLAPFLSIESELRKKLGAFERDTTSMASSISCTLDGSERPGDKTGSCLGSANLRRHQNAIDLLLRAGWQDEVINHAGIRSSSFEGGDSSSVAESTISAWSIRRRRPHGRIGSKIGKRGTIDSCTEETEAALQSGSSRYKSPQQEDDPSRLLSACVNEIQDLWEGPSSNKIKARLYGADSAA